MSQSDFRKKEEKIMSVLTQDWRHIHVDQVKFSTCGIAQDFTSAKSKSKT